ncbi:MAG: diguanylate cyclase [Gallionellaceae bacterium]|nr:diguanylate cyclase [Gallionellaceae bacterium]
MTIKWPRSRSLQLKFFVGILLVTALSLLLLVFNGLHVFKRDMLQQTEKNTRQYAMLLDLAISKGLIVGEYGPLQKLLDDAYTKHNFCYLAIQNTQVETLAAAGIARDQPLPPLDTDITESDDNSCFDSVLPLTKNGQPFGSLRFGVPVGERDNLTQQIIQQLLWTSLLWLCLFAVVLYFLLRWLTKPLRKLTEASNLIALGNLDVDLPNIRSVDEVGQLNNAFRSMVNMLRSRIEHQNIYAHQLFSERARLDALLSIMPVGVLFADGAHRIQYCNNQFRRLWKLDENEKVVGCIDTELLSRLHSQVVQAEVALHSVNKSIEMHVASQPFDIELKSGGTIRARSCPVPDETGKRHIGRVWLCEDVTDEHQHLQYFQFLSERDALTGLYNRRRFEDELTRLFAQAHRNSTRLTLLFFDLDDFKPVNDSFGHAAGDIVLKEVGKILAGQVRRSEIVCRLGGDEFAMLIPDAAQHEIETLAQRIIETISQATFYFDGQEVHLCCSAGIAFYPDHADTAATLMQHADRAMYQAKHAGKNTLYVYTPPPPGQGKLTLQ